MQKVTIIGSGPAGLTAAIYAARAGLNPVLYAGLEPGGQLTTTTEIENFPGFALPIGGKHLMAEMTKQAERVGTQIFHQEIERVDFSSQPLRLWSAGKEIVSQTVIVATGARAKTLGLANEASLMGRGVSTCATCDGFFYRKKNVIVVGGGDSAMEETLYLANICHSVTLVHRRDVFRASDIMLKRAKQHPNIHFKTPYGIEELVYDQTGLLGVKLVQLETKVKEELPIDGLFYGIGHEPNSQLFKPYVDLDSHGYIKVQSFTKTRTPGLFAAGDIADPHFRQAVTAAGMGCQAAIEAAKYLESLD
ncbi:MAG: thioredoxin-disulfide reductase [Oligoflexales bacterium]|nr:thioredoxin-disulfide reductase [Oligoflexales bacterium]